MDPQEKFCHNEDRRVTEANPQHLTIPPLIVLDFSVGNREMFVAFAFVRGVCL